MWYKFKERFGYRFKEIVVTWIASFRSHNKPESKLPWHLLRHLKMNFTFWEVEKLRTDLSTLRKGLTTMEFNVLCEDLSRDLEHYGK